MSWDGFEKGWNEIRSLIASRWDKLTEEDVAAIGGRREELSQRLQKRYGFSAEEAERQMNDWIRDPGVLDDWNDRRPILDM
jgi:uncharacterized protein YjbJ (UPF0337 family)